jgi:alkylation response protein AidB-like acyl-CoA dehydrogenase
LPAKTAAALRDMGLFWLKTQAELGGDPLAPLDFCDVIEEFAYADASVAWAAMIGAGCDGLAAGWLPDAGAVFTDPLPVIAGQLSPRGTGSPVDGGYVVTGRWGFPPVSPTPRGLSVLLHPPATRGSSCSSCRRSGLRSSTTGTSRELGSAVRGAARA